MAKRVGADARAEQYMKLCDFFWRFDHPETPKDGLYHTSDVCRDRATQVLKILGLDEQHRRDAEKHLKSLSLKPEQFKRFLSYMQGEDE